MSLSLPYLTRAPTALFKIARPSTAPAHDKCLDKAVTFEVFKETSEM
jgi:hypothetical protein